MTEIHPDENGTFTIPEAGLYEYRGGQLRKVEIPTIAVCIDCGLELHIDPAPEQPFGLVHKTGGSTHRLNPPVKIAAGARVQAVYRGEKAPGVALNAHQGFTMDMIVGCGNE